MSETVCDGKPVGKVPYGGSTGQVLKKTSNEDYALAWGTGGSGGAAWGDITGTLSNQVDLQTAIDSKSATTHNHDAVYASISHTHPASEISDSTATGRSVLTAASQAAARTAIDAAASNVVTTHEAALDPHPQYAVDSHAHAAADITSGTVATARLGSGTADATTFLRGDQTWATPGGGSDPWTYIVLGSDFSSSLASSVDVTGMGFTPTANTRYIFEGTLFTRTATTTVGIRPSIAWPTGMTDGVSAIQQTSSATASVFANGNPSNPGITPVGGLPTTTGSWPCTVWGAALTGASPSGNIRLQIASETAGTNVTVKAGSFIRYRPY